MKKIIFVGLLFMLSISAIAQQSKAVLPFTMINGKMIVGVEVNGVLKKAIFDTGAAKNMVTETMMKELGLKATSTQVVTDVNSNKSEYKKTSIDKLSIPTGNIAFKGYEVLVLETNPFECFGVELLIGSEMFAKTIVEIDGKKETITITSAEILPKASLRNSRPFLENDYMPIVEVDLDGMGVPTLFDTGFGGFFSFKREDHHKNISALKVIAESLTEGSIGIGGKSAASMSYRVLVGRMNVNSTKFCEAVITTQSSPYSLLGTKLLDYGTVIIDYAHKKFFFEPYEKIVIVPQPLNDYDLMVKDGKLVISSVWSSDTNDIHAGDVVTHINGKPTPELDFCKSITVGISELKTKSKSTLTVKTKDGVKKINYIYKK